MSIPIVVLFALSIVGAILIFAVQYSRYNARALEHKETIAALEKGVALPARPTEPWTPRIYLLRGMIWLFAGLSSTFALLALTVTVDRQIPAEQLLSVILDARARGATPEEIQMLRNAPQQRGGLPIGFGLLGLIPTSIGLAYLAFYRTESKKLLS